MMPGFKRPLPHRLIASAALCLLSAESLAKEIKGTPDALLGTYGTSVQECKDEKEQYAFDTPYYRTCASPGCWKRIVSHTVTPTGFRLKIRDDGNFKEWTEQVTMIDKNTIKWRATTSAILHRCSGYEPSPEITRLPDRLFMTDFLTAAYTFTFAPRRDTRRYYRLYTNKPGRPQNPLRQYDVYSCCIE
jgi:hypothetical protein